MTLDAGSAHGQSTGSEVIGGKSPSSNVNLHGSFVSLYVRGQNFTWQGGSLGQDGVNGGQRSCNTGDGEPVWIESSAAGATLSGIRFNSMSASGAACSGSVDGFHLEYVRVQAAQNVTIQNSTFVPDAGTGNGAGSGKDLRDQRLVQLLSGERAHADRQHLRNRQGLLLDPDPRERSERQRLADQEQQLRATGHEPQPPSRRRMRQHRTRRSVMENSLLDRL